MNTQDSPEYFVAWVKKRFLRLKSEDIKDPIVLEAVKSWIKAGDDSYKDFHGWITLKVYMYLVCWLNDIDIIESLLDYNDAKQILSEVNIDPLTPLALTKIPKSIDFLKSVFMESAWHVIKEHKDDKIIEKLFVLIFSAYSVLLQNRLSLDGFKKENNNEV